MPQIKRPSPTISATSIDPFNIAIGNDRNIWCNVPSGTSYKWIKIFSVSKNTITNINLRLLFKIQLLMSKQKKITMSFVNPIDISDTLAVGDSHAIKLQQFNNKKYFIYTLQCGKDYNIIASNKKISSLSSLFNKKFYVRFNDIVTVDTGGFLFYDYALAKNYTHITFPKSKQIYVPMYVSSKSLKNRRTQHYSYTPKDMDIHLHVIDKKKYPDKHEYNKLIYGNDDNKIIIVDTGNGFGDGTFFMIFDESNNIVMQCSTFLSGVFYETFSIINKKSPFRY